MKALIRAAYRCSFGACLLQTLNAIDSILWLSSHHKPLLDHFSVANYPQTIYCIHAGFQTFPAHTWSLMLAAGFFNVCRLLWTAMLALLSLPDFALSSSLFMAVLPFSNLVGATTSDS